MANQQIAILGAGCFWCIESALNRIKGVESAVSGYSGGHVDNPTYQDICTGQSNHAEVVKVTFDADVLSYEMLLNFFFQLHDPTQLNRQGNDIGTQYRSVIYYLDDVQYQTSIKKIHQLNEEQIWSSPIVTEVSKAETFYPAEDYHQDYVSNNPQQPYCQLVVIPKLNSFLHKYQDYLKS